jgi:putative ABC transport system substrate-binding protein
MKRREFITLLGGAGVAWPLPARAQQPAMPVVGLLYSASPNGMAFFVTAFRNDLQQTGHIEGQNVAVTSAGKLTLGPAIFPEQD